MKIPNKVPSILIIVGLLTSVISMCIGYTVMGYNDLYLITSIFAGIGAGVTSSGLVLLYYVI